MGGTTAAAALAAFVGGSLGNRKNDKQFDHLLPRDVRAERDRADRAEYLEKKLRGSRRGRKRLDDLLREDDDLSDKLSKFKRRGEKKLRDEFGDAKSGRGRNWGDWFHG